MNENKVHFWAWVGVGVLAVGICIAVNWLLRPASAQFDLTQDKRYTIPPGLERIAQKIGEEAKKNEEKEPVKITVYLSESLPRYIEHLPRTISTRLNEIRRASGGRIAYEFVDPKDDIDLMTELQEKFKIQPIPLQDVREGEVTQGSYYLAMVFRHKNQVEQLNLQDLRMELVKEERTLAALPGLIAAKLIKVTTPPEEVVVGIISDKKNPPPQQQQEKNKPTDGLELFRERLKAHAHTKDVSVKGGTPVPPDVKTLILYKPEALTPLEVFQLDQFLMRGGRLIVLLDTFSAFDYDRIQAINQALSQDKFSLRPIESGLKDWLAFYGLDVRPGVVMDRINHKTVRLFATPGRLSQETQDIPGLLNVREQDADKKPTGQLDQSEITLAGIGSLAFLLPAPMQVNKETFSSHNPGATLDVLARSSSESWVQKDVTDSVAMSKVTPPPREEWGSSVLVARASGPLRSYWADKEVPRRDATPTPDSNPADATKVTVAPTEKPPQLWVIADSDFMHDVWINSFARMNAIGAAQGMGVSSSMVMNMVDVSALGSDLVEIRRQRLIDRSLDEARVKEDHTKIRLLNIALMPAVFILFGLLWWVFRSVQTFVPSPRQPVTVPSATPQEEKVLDEAAVAEKTDSHS